MREGDGGVKLGGVGEGLAYDKVKDVLLLTRSDFNER